MVENVNRFSDGRQPVEFLRTFHLSESQSDLQAELWIEALRQMQNSVLQGLVRPQTTLSQSNSIDQKITVCSRQENVVRP